MPSEKDSELSDLTKHLISKQDAMRIASSFHSKIVLYLKKNRMNMLTLTGAPRIQGISTTMGHMLERF